MRPRRRATIGCTATATALLATVAASAAVIEIRPQNADDDCNERFETIANRLKPGDELVLRGGVYSQSCRRAITAVGTAARPIVIRAADGEHVVLTRPDGNLDTQNNLEVLNSAYLVIRGLHLRGGSVGVRFRGGHAITFEDNEVSHTGAGAVTLNQGDTSDFVLRRNHLHHTGLSRSGATEGEGLYLGCHRGGCAATGHLVADNLIHDLRATSHGGNDGIEIKAGSGGNIVQGNRIYRTTIGRKYPCIFVYGGGAAPNVVAGNTLHDCGEGIQVVSDAIVVNNVIGPSVVAGITAAPHAAVASIERVRIVNNTVYGSPVCLYLDWRTAVDVALYNNALYCSGGRALQAAGFGNDAAAGANYTDGAVTGADAHQAAFIDGGDAMAAFADPAGRDYRLRPGSTLIDAGFLTAPDIPPRDHAGRRRVIGPSVDVGAFEFDRDDDDIAGSEDNCVDVGNPDQRDTDGDGIGNACDADIAPLPNDCLVDFADLAAVKSAFLATPQHPDWNADADFNGDNAIDFADLALLEVQLFRDLRRDNPSGIANACAAR